MSSLSTQNLVKYLIQKDKYKQTCQYIKQVELQNQDVYSVINQALHHILVTNQNPITSKLFGLRFFKDLFISAQFQLIDGLHQSIFKQIVKACQFDKENKDKSKRGSSYFQQVQKRKKQADLQKISFSFVLFSTEIVYAMGTWYKLDENQQQTDYAAIFQKLKKSGVQFPSNDKQLKFFKVDQKQLFLKNYKQWVQKLPQIQQESEEGEQKQNANQKSKKSIKSKKNIDFQQYTGQKIKQNGSSNVTQNKPLKIQDQNITEKKTLIVNGQNKTEKQISLKFQQQYNQFLKKLQLAQNKNKQQVTKIAELESQFKKQRIENDEKLLKIEDQYKKKIQTLNQNEKEIKKEALDLKDKLSGTIKEKCILQKEIACLKIKIQQNEKNKQKLSTALHAEESLFKKKYNQCEKILRKKESIIFQLQLKSKQQIQKLKKQVQKVQKDLKDRQKQKQQLREINTKLEISKQNQQVNVENLGQKAQSSRKNISRKQDKMGKKEQIGNQIEQIVEFYTKQIVQLKDKIKTLQNEKQEIEQKTQKIQNQLKLTKQKLNLANQQTVQLQKINIAIQNKIKNQQNKVDLQKNNAQLANKSEGNNNMLLMLQNNKYIRPCSTKEKFQQQCVSQSFVQNKILQKRENSMSDYLQSKIVFQPSLNSDKTKVYCFQNKVDQKQSHQEKPKRCSLGKTQNSLQKMKLRKSRYSGGKTFHYTNNQIQKISQNFRPNTALQIKGHTNSYSNLLYSLNNSKQIAKVAQNNNPFHKKSSALLLNKRETVNIGSKQKQIQTLIPYIDNYFTINSSMSFQDNFIFRSLCIYPSYRQSQIIFGDNVLQVKILNSSENLKQIFILQVKNISANTIKIKALSCHDQFKLFGEKIRFIQASCLAEYQIQTKSKDLNLRFPIVSLIVSQQSCFKKQLNNKTYNIPLPLTLLDFTEFDSCVPNFMHSEEVKVFNSQTFSISKKHQSIVNCLQNLQFRESKNEIFGQGTLRHRFIQNIQTYFKISQIGRQIKLQFFFRDYDQVSQNYSKVMIQVLMFLLK